jgi:hypothetical protein
MLRRLRENVAHLDAALAVFLEGEWRWHRGPGWPLRCEIPGGNQFVRPFRQGRFRIESVQLRWSAIQIDVNDVFRAPGKLRRLGRERIHRSAVRSRREQTRVL